MIKILPNPWLKYSSNSAIRSNFSKTIINGLDIEDNWSVFPFNSYWSDEFIPSSWELTIEGKFTDSTFFRLESFKGNYSQEIFLSSTQDKFKIPIEIFEEFNWAKIYFGFKGKIEITNIVFKAKDIKEGVKKVYPIVDPRNINGSVWREGELGHFTLTNHINDETVIYCRPVTELVTNKDKEKIWMHLDLLQNNTKAKIVNHIKHLEKHSLKNESFKIWSLFNIPFPKYWVWNNSNKIIKKMRELKNPLLVRLNNGTNSAYSTYFKGIIPSYLENIMWKRKYEGITGTNIIFVEKIKSLTYNNKEYVIGGKAYICGGKVLMCVPDIFNLSVDQTVLLGPRVSDLEIFLDAAKRCESIKYKWANKMVLALNCLGLDCGVLDFIIDEMGNPVFLEANSFWGWTSIYQDFPFNQKIENYLIENEEKLNREFKDVYNRINKISFWQEFYENL